MLNDLIRPSERTPQPTMEDKLLAALRYLGERHALGRNPVKYDREHPIVLTPKPEPTQ